MSLEVIVLTALFFIVVGVAYCIGWDYMKRTMPEHLVLYYLLAAVLRFLLVAIIILAFIKLAEASRGDNIRFSLMVIAMYVVMMVVTLSLKHK